MGKTTDFLRKLDEFQGDVARELERVQQELREIDVLIRQSTAEVERLAQRNVQIQNKVRQMEANFDTVPREDIRALYTAAQESQMRLFTMRSQVEQLQHKQRVLEQYAQYLERFLELSRSRSDESALSSGEALLDQAELSRLTVMRIIEAQESERRQLARQMHDGPAQSLTNLILQAEICERLFDTDKSRAKVELTNLKNAANATFQKVRDFIFDLRPMMLDDLGLAPTVKRYVDAYQRKVDYRITLHVTGEERRLPAPVEITLFRALQELLQNVTRHANANQVLVQLGFQDDDVVLSVEDDGTGFEVTEALQSSQHGRAVGLAAMQERIEMLGGQFHVDSSIGRGTRVYIRVPIAEAEQELS